MITVSLTLITKIAADMILLLLQKWYNKDFSLLLIRIHAKNY